MNAGHASYHALTASLRRQMRNGIYFDFNYTWSHSIDNGSAAESGAGQQGAAIQNIFNTNEFRGSSDFDMRHNISANVVYDLPFGKGRTLFSNASSWMNQIVGGWQVSGVARYHTGLPTTVAGNLAYNANYWLSSLAILTGPIRSGLHTDENGNPSLFASLGAANTFADELPGHSGTKAILRLPGFFNTDMTLAKVIKLREAQRIQLRAEVFNVFNSVNFTNPSLALTSPLTFGEFQNTTDPRVMQFAVRFEF
jgi:hypothetical protein